MRKRILYLTALTLGAAALCYLTIFLQSLREKQEADLPSEELRMETVRVIGKRAAAFYGYWGQVPALDWAAACEDALKGVRAAETRVDYFCVLSDLVSQLKDGHSGILWTDLQKNSYDARAQFPFVLSYLEGRFVLSGLREGTEGLTLGAEVRKINDQPTEDWLEERFGGWTGLQTSGARQQTLAALAILSWERGESLALSGLDPTGEPFSRTIASGGESGKWERLSVDWAAGLPVVRRFAGYASFAALELEGGIFAVRFPDFQNPALGEEFAAWMEAVGPDAEGFLLDLRGNGGGNSIYGMAVLDRFWDVFAMDSVLENDSLPGARQAAYAATADSGLVPYLAKELDSQEGRTYLDEGRSILAGETPSEGDANLPMQSGEARPLPSPRWEQPVALLTDWNCGSAGDCVAAYAAAAGERFTLIGTHTRGTLGDVGYFALPGGLTLSLSCVNTHWADGTPLVNKGVSPDIWAEQTLEDALRGVDSVARQAWLLLQVR